MTDTVKLAGHSFSFHLLESHAWWPRETLKDAWEPILLQSLAESLLPGDTFLDIGSWIGPYAVLASRLVTESGKVFACEPDPVARELLRKNVAQNGCTNVTILDHAICERDGPILLAKGKEFGDSTTSLATATSEHTVQVDGLSLKTLCLRRSIRPNVVKMDVEGAEEKIIRGAGRALAATRTMFVEVHRSQLAFQGTCSERFLSMATLMTGMQWTILEEAKYNSTVVFHRRTKSTKRSQPASAAADR